MPHDQQSETRFELKRIVAAWRVLDRCHPWRPHRLLPLQL